jgi:hypothetical protein
MGKTKEEYLRKYPFRQEDCFQDKPCPDCSGIGSVAESNCCGGSIMEGTCLICKKPTEATKCITCNGTGIVDYTEEDAQNDEENEIIGNAEMMKDE